MTVCLLQHIVVYSICVLQEHKSRYPLDGIVAAERIGFPPVDAKSLLHMPAIE